MSKAASLFWEYFTPLDGVEKAECNECKKPIATGGGTTSGLKKHLKIHKQVYEDYLMKQSERDKNKEKPVKKRPSAADNFEKPLKQMKIGFGNETFEETQKIFDETLVYFVAETGTAFNVLGTDAFKDVIKVANKLSCLLCPF